MGVIVVSSYLPKEGERPYRSDHFRVVGLPCQDDLDYFRGLEAVWSSPDTIVNVEHDMECSDLLIQELLNCEQPLCTHSYKLRSWQHHYCHRNGPLPPAGAINDNWVRPGDEWATFGGIGFCKITPEARVRPLQERHWATLDIHVTRAVEGPETVPDSAQAGKRWHVHWPEIRHYHEPEVV